MDVGTGVQGGNLTLESEQDQANFKSKNSSLNAGIGVSPNQPNQSNTIGSTISLGSGKVNSTYNSVIEQTAIRAGDGGFSINVAVYRPRVRYNFTIDFKLFFNQMGLKR